MAEKVLIESDPAANDDGPLVTPERTAKVAAYIDDPCDEGGYDAFCRDRHGNLCQFHEEFCHAPDYPCIDRLRHFLAVSFLEEIAQRRARERSSSSPLPTTERDCGYVVPACLRENGDTLSYQLREHVGSQLIDDRPQFAHDPSRSNIRSLP